MTSALKSKPASTELPLLAVSVPGGKASWVRRDCRGPGPAIGRGHRCEFGL